MEERADHSPLGTTGGTGCSGMATARGLSSLRLFGSSASSGQLNARLLCHAVTGRRCQRYPQSMLTRSGVAKKLRCSLATVRRLETKELFPSAMFAACIGSTSKRSRKCSSDSLVVARLRHEAAGSRPRDPKDAEANSAREQLLAVLDLRETPPAQRAQAEPRPSTSSARMSACGKRTQNSTRVLALSSTERRSCSSMALAAMCWSYSKLPART